jgi:hypothetical protein
VPKCLWASTVPDPAEYHRINVRLHRRIFLGGILKTLKRVGVKAIHVGIVDKIGFHDESNPGVSIAQCRRFPTGPGIQVINAVLPHYVSKS